MAFIEKGIKISSMINNKDSAEIKYPIRINKYLFLEGYCSRRMADKLIQNGEVFLNGKKAILGQKVNLRDKVTVSKRVSSMPQNYGYFLFNKPRGVVSHNPGPNEKSFEAFINFTKPGNLAPVGRLDKDSEGLMFLTDDGRIIDKILNPKFEHEKEYVVTVDKKINNLLVKKIESGVVIERYKTKPAKIHVVNKWVFKIILVEGKKHQIRRMCAALGYQVKKLKRLRIMNLKLNNLKSGEIRALTEEEKVEILKLIR